MGTVWIETLGWIAAGFTLAAYSMRTMLPLRVTAIAANLFFISYSLMAGILPTLVLHCLLLPFNLYRLSEILSLTRKAKAARKGDFSLEWVTRISPPRAHADGTILFRKGDTPDALFYLVKGTVRLVEADIVLQAPEIFGEIAFFTDAHQRTLTARCDGPCQIVRVNEASFMRLYYQNPAFGVYIVRLISRRLLEGMERNPAAYLATGADAGGASLSPSEEPADRG